VNHSAIAAVAIVAVSEDKIRDYGHDFQI